MMEREQQLCKHPVTSHLATSFTQMSTSKFVIGNEWISVESLIDWDGFMFSTFDPSGRCVRCCQVVYNLDSFQIVLNCVNISVLIARSFPEFASKMFQIPFSVSELPNVFRVFPSIFHLIVAWTINERAYISVVTTNEKAKSTETTQQQIHARSKFIARLEFHFGGNVFVTKKNL